MKIGEMLNKPIGRQQEVIDKMKKVKVGALFMKQGTGKTYTALSLVRLRMEADKVDMLVWLCPHSAKQNIKEEIIKQAPREMLSKIVICGIESLSTSIRLNSYLLHLVTENRCFLVVDESLLIKNPKAYRTKNITRLAGKCEYKLILNGTPVSKNEADLYSQFYLLDWRILGYKSYWAFARNHIVYDDTIPSKIDHCTNINYLSQRIEPYTFVVDKPEDVPPKRYFSWSFNMTKEQERHYDDVAFKLMLGIQETRPETIYRLFSGLQNVICGYRVIFTSESHFEREPFFKNKMENPRLKCFMDHIKNEDKAIIYCINTDEITWLTDSLNEKYGAGAAVRFDGTISVKDRDRNRKKFKNDATFFVANKRCAGYSLNLQFCHNEIYYSNDWDFATRDQSEDRVHRYGQEHEVSIYDMYANNSLDERIINCLWRKESLMESFRRAVKNQENMMNWSKNSNIMVLQERNEQYAESV